MTGISEGIFGSESHCCVRVRAKLSRSMTAAANEAQDVSRLHGCGRSPRPSGPETAYPWSYPPPITAGRNIRILTIPIQNNPSSSTCLIHMEFPLRIGRSDAHVLSYQTSRD